MSRLRNRRGFTLVELVLVIAILAILAGIAIPSVMNILDKTKNSTDQATARNFENGIKLYVAQIANSGSATILPSAPTEAQSKLIENAIVQSMGTTASFIPKSEGWEFYVNTQTYSVIAAESSPGSGFSVLYKQDVVFKEFTSAELPQRL